MKVYCLIKHYGEAFICGDSMDVDIYPSFEKCKQALIESYEKNFDDILPTQSLNKKDSVHDYNIEFELDREYKIVYNDIAWISFKIVEKNMSI